MSAVTRTEAWPSRSETVTKSTPSASRHDPWVWRSVCKLAPLGRPSRRQSWDAEEETELGFSGGSRRLLEPSHELVQSHVVNALCNRRGDAIEQQRLQFLPPRNPLNCNQIGH